MGALRGDEAGEPVATGHDGQRGRGAGQQLLDVLCVAGVVQHDEHPTTGQQAAVQRGLRVQTLRDALRWYAQSVEEPADRLLRRSRPATGVESAQVHVQLAVRKPVSYPVRPMDRQRGLAYSSRATDRGDHHRAGGDLPAVGEPVQFVQLGQPAGEAVDRGRELTGHDGRARGAVGPAHARYLPRPGVPGRRAQARVGGQDASLQVLQLLSRLYTELVHEQPANALVGGQRLTLPPALVERHHQLGPKPFPQRMASDQPGELRDELAVPAQGQTGIDPPLGRLQPLCL